ncbi:MAG: hypothetical protein WC980_06960 [Candidatus Brocadiia bacterium]
MGSYKKIVLNEKALEFITSVLYDLANIKNYGNGKNDPVKFEGKILAKLISDSVNLKQGTIYTILPGGTSLDQVYSFEYGGVLPQLNKEQDIIMHIKGLKIPRPDNFIQLYSIIEEYLKKDEENICIFIDAMRNADDKGSLKERTDSFTFQNNIYRYITPTNAEENKIETMVKAFGSGWRAFTGILTKADKIDTPPFNKMEITLKKLEILAKNTSKIIINAYDGEGFLIWEKVD